MSTIAGRSGLLLIMGMVVNLIIFPLNHIVGSVVNHGDYTPFAAVPEISAQVYDETQLYVPGPSRFFRVGQVRAELDVFELRDLPNSYPVLHSILLGLLAKAIGSLEWGWMVAHSIAPTLIWAALFWNASRYVCSDALALAIAWAVCFIAFSPRNFLLFGHDWFIQPLELTRMPQPALAFLFLILAIWLLSRALVKPSLIRILGAGVFAGALFYLYYFYWIAFFAGTGSLLLVVATIKRWNHVKTIVCIMTVGFLVGIPFLLSTINATRSGGQLQLMKRVGTFTREPDLIGLILALALVGSLWSYCSLRIRVESDHRTLFAAVLLAVATGAAIGLNFQLLTGFNAQHGHFYNRALQPLLTYLLLLIVFSRIRRPPVVVTAAIIGVLITVAAVRQVQAGRNTAPYHRETNPDIEVLSWVRSQLPPDSVIGSYDGTMLTLIPSIAGTWTFVPLGDRSMASDEEILTRYLLLCRLEGRNWREVETELKLDLGFRWSSSGLGYILLMHYKMLPETIETARAIWRNIDLRSDFKHRRLDYLITRQTDRVPVFPESGERMTILYNNSSWRVSRVLR